MKVARPVSSVLLVMAVSILPLSAQDAPTSTSRPGSIVTPRPINPATNSTNPSALVGQKQNPYLGSVPTGNATPVPLQLSLQDAVTDGLRFNLGVIDSKSDTRASRAERLRRLAALLPDVSGLVRQNVDNLSRTALGLKVPGLPETTGTFSFQEAYVSGTEGGLNLERIRQFQSAVVAADAQTEADQDSREVTVFAVVSSYLLVVASEARVKTARAQLDSARELEAEADNKLKSQLATVVDDLRSKVQRHTAEQRLAVLTAESEKDKLTLARIIGLPRGQKFDITDSMPFRPWNGPIGDAALQAAYRSRHDLRSAEQALRSAETARKGARAERVPSLSFGGIYGALGNTLSHSNATYQANATLNVPILTSGRIRADIEQADSVVDRRRAEFEDLVGRVDYDVRNALWDLEASATSVGVAEENVDLARRTLEQSRDRFLNGVTNNLEVIQAQEALISAEENLVSSRYSHSIAKLELLRAMGLAEKGLSQYFGR